MSKIIVTGASGFIGSHLLSKLIDDGHTLHAFDSKFGDITSEETWKKFPSSDIVIHLAAKTFVPESWKNPRKFMSINFLGTMQALEYCRINGSRLIYLSSYMYGDAKVLPISETAEISAKNPYALSKKLAEELCQFYRSNHNIDVTIFRPFNAYGANQASTFLIPSIIKQVVDGKSIQVMDLAPKRDFIYIKDLVDAISMVVNFKSGGGIFNLGSGVSHSVGNLIEIIQNLFGSSLPVISDNKKRAGEIMDTVADITLARQDLGWQPKFSLRDGLEDMITDLKRK
jgi:nucleoside-diphosphate-sugar epimerase